MSATNDWLELADRHRVSLACYRSANPKAKLIFLHGIQSHAGWYDASCRYFAGQGFDVYFINRRGSGLDHLSRGDCRNWQQLTDDVRQYVQYVKQQQDHDLPIFLSGISWGGKIALAMFAEQAWNGPPLAGMMFLCPGWIAQVYPYPHEQLQILRAAFLRPSRKLRVPLSDPYLFTDVLLGKEFIASDPLALRFATARLLWQSRLLDRVIRQPIKLPAPSLLVLAGNDRIIDNAKTEALFRQLQAPSQKVMSFPHANHTFEWDNQARHIWSQIADWIDQQTGEQSIRATG